MSLHVNAQTKYLNGTVSISTTTSVSKILWVKPNVSAQSVSWDLMDIIHTGSGARSFAMVVSTKVYRGGYATTQQGAVLATGSTTATNAWTLVGTHAPAEDGNTQQLKMRALAQSVDTSTRTTSATPQTKTQLTIGRATNPATNVQDAKFAKVAVYTGLSLATFNSLFDAIYNNYTVENEYKAPDHPDALAIAVPLYLWDLNTDLSNNAEASNTLTLTNNGTTGFDGADNPVFAAAVPPTITSIQRGNYIGL